MKIQSLISFINNLFAFLFIIVLDFILLNFLSIEKIQIESDYGIINEFYLFNLNLKASIVMSIFSILIYYLLKKIKYLIGFQTLTISIVLLLFEFYKFGIHELDLRIYLSKILFLSILFSAVFIKFFEFLLNKYSYIVLITIIFFSFVYQTNKGFEPINFGVFMILTFLILYQEKNIFLGNFK